MGTAVNRAARLQGLTRELARPVLTSADFAAFMMILSSRWVVTS